MTRFWTRIIIAALAIFAAGLVIIHYSHKQVDRIVTALGSTRVAIASGKAPLLMGGKQVWGT
ncbi:MAG: hypothetical protein ACOY71_05360 [Gemmatimonadota bacterium]